MPSRVVQTTECPEFVIRERVYAPGGRMTRHAHAYTNITIVINGEIVEAAEEGEYRARSCSVVLKPAGCEHEDLIGGRGARTLAIELKRGQVADEAGRRPWAWFDRPDVVRAAIALHRAPNEEGAWALLAAVLASRQRKETSPAWIAGVLDVLHERFDEPPRLDALARDFGFHPVYFSRAFHQHVQVSLTEYVRALRLRHARHLLATSKRSVTAIAAESGFFDSSHLSRTFASLLDVTPKQYRSLCREVQPVQIAARHRA